jgi:hypothetical protein
LGALEGRYVKIGRASLAVPALEGTPGRKATDAESTAIEVRILLMENPLGRHS